MQPCPPSGASIFWTSPDPLAEKARDLVNRGDLSEADRMLASAGGQSGRLAEEGREIIRRIRHDYDLTLEKLLTRVRKVLPETTAEDIERWCRAGQVQHRMLDGRLCYWGREPSNLWRFCDEAKRRRATAEGRDPNKRAESAAGERGLMAHVRKVVEAARLTGKVEVEPVRHTIRYSLTVHGNRPGAHAGSLVRCWLAFPQEYRQQREIRLIQTTPAGHVVAPTSQACSDECTHQRTIYLEQTITDPSEPIRFTAEYEYLSYAYCPRLDDAKVRPAAGADLSIYLQERLPHISFTPALRATVEQIVAGEPNPLARARRIFRWFNQNIRYAFEEEYSTIPSFSEKAFRVRQGDCGIQAMLFITMCRLAGVPARWQSGWATFPGDSTMHDWAEIHIEPWGWLPVDVSYGTKSSDDPEVREFYFGHQDAYRLISNLDYGCELFPPKQSLRSETADFQRGEVEIDGRNLYFDEWDHKFEFDVEPVESK